MAREPDKLMTYQDVAEMLRKEFPTHDIRVVRGRDELGFEARRKPGAEGPFAVVGDSERVRRALTRTAEDAR